MQKNSNRKFGNEDNIIIINSSVDEDDNQIINSYADEDYDNNEELSVASLLGDDTPSDPAVVSSPVLKKRFGDGTQVKTYSGPGIGQPRLSPSQISFSPKWVNRVPSKYNSPSDVPASESLMTFLDESPGRSSWSSGASSLSESTSFRVWEDFVKETKSLPKSSTHSKRKSRRRQPYDAEELLKSPTHESDPYDEENIWEHRIVVKRRRKEVGKSESLNVNATLNRARDNNVSKPETLILKDTSPNIQHSESESRAMKNARFSPKFNANDSARHLGESSKTNNESIPNTDRSLLGIGSPPRKKSKPKITSIRTVKKPYLL